MVVIVLTLQKKIQRDISRYLVKDSKAKEVAYGINEKADLRIDKIEYSLDGTNFNLKYKGKYVAHQFCLLHDDTAHLSNEAFDIDVKEFSSKQRQLSIITPPNGVIRDDSGKFSGIKRYMTVDKEKWKAELQMNNQTEKFGDEFSDTSMSVMIPNKTQDEINPDIERH